MNSEQLRQATALLLESVGLKGEFASSPLQGGANNKVFRVDVGGEKVLLKAYFQHPGDSRNRLNAEFSFSRFAWDNGVQCIPRPIAFDSSHQLGLYEFVEGCRIESWKVTRGMVMQAVEFYMDLNRHRTEAAAKQLPNASEACFCIGDHIRCVERRLDALRAVEPLSPVYQQAVLFIQGSLSEAWKQISESVVNRAGELGLSLEAEISPEERRLSPSDFGFHNALVDERGWVRFIDFEYAGWDDPDKLACDLFCLQGVRVPPVYHELFVKAVAEDLPDPKLHLERIRFLIAVHQVKWCCILLNDFLPVGSQRRRFADPLGEQVGREEIQLQKARAALQEVRVRSPQERFISGAM